jgi:tRNA threonylcarbamoyl adenosine modification protein (Sua5/YciO/YrdC/YwlC family)
VRASAFERCIRAGGVVLFPSDTIYGLACDPDNPAAVRRLYELKGRPPAKATAVMFFDRDAALAALPELGHRTRAALGELMPGGVTVLLTNPLRRYPLACGEDPGTLGLRVVAVPPLEGVTVPVMQSSANLSGGPEARRLEDVAAAVRDGADLAVDGGELPGTASTVVDLRTFEADGSWSVLRPGAMGDEALQAALGGQFHFDPDTYPRKIRQDIPGYEEFQECLVLSSGVRRVRRILELGTGTGETARRLLDRYPESRLVGIDESPAMLEVARRGLPADRVELRVARLQDELPRGPFDLVASALAVHHLDGKEKADLFCRVREAMSGGGRFTLADVVLPIDSGDARISITPGFDKPDSTADQLAWLAQAGFAAHVAWQQRDLAVIVADLPGW